MQITLTNTGKRFNLEWIFRYVNFTFFPGNAYAIVGSNGSGKSTLLQVIAGALLHSEGQITYKNDADKNNISEEEAFKEIAIATPYLELIEEMTAVEFLKFHETFKPLSSSIESILQEIGLSAASHKQIRYFSSGMKQRLKLAQAIFSKTSVLLLDEPCTNLDTAGIELYHTLIRKYRADRLIIVSSNDKTEYSFCKEIIAIEDYK